MSFHSQSTFFPPVLIHRVFNAACVCNNGVLDGQMGVRRLNIVRDFQKAPHVSFVCDISHSFHFDILRCVLFPVTFVTHKFTMWHFGFRHVTHAGSFFNVCGGSSASSQSMNTVHWFGFYSLQYFIVRYILSFGFIRHALLKLMWCNTTAHNSHYNKDCGAKALLKTESWHQDLWLLLFAHFYIKLW